MEVVMPRISSRDQAKKLRAIPLIKRRQLYALCIRLTELAFEISNPSSMRSLRRAFHDAEVVFEDLALLRAGAFEDAQRQFDALDAEYQRAHPKRVKK